MKRMRYFNSYYIKAFALVALMLGIFIVCGAPGYYCGDGTVDIGEECDDGNNMDGDGCSAECTIEPYCGDGVVDMGEECDDGNNMDGDGCSANCTIEEQESCYCSPGYWKNHTEVWFGMGIGGDIDDETLLCMLMPQCGSDRATREAATMILNDYFAGDCPCEE